MTKLVIVFLVTAGVTLGGQTAATQEPVHERAAAAMQALDRYLETWNSRDAARWATSLHFPHVRPGPGAFELSTTPAEYIRGVDFEKTQATGWHHSEWVSRKVLHIGEDKAHIAGAWQRYTAEDRPLVGSIITYVVTKQAGRWGVLSRFAAGSSGLALASSNVNAEAARAAVADYFRAWSSRDHATLAAAIHYPHVRIDGTGALELWPSAKEFLAGSEPARQRTWFETRLDHAEVVQVSAEGVNVVVRYSRRDREARVLSEADAVVLVVRRGDVWKVQAVSTMGV